MQQIYQTLGKVTGDEDEDGESTSKHTRSSQNGYDEKLSMRAEEIVLIVEQIQAQYTLLEQEMRQVVEKSDMREKKPVSSQTDMRESDINDMVDHYEAIKGTVRTHDS